MMANRFAILRELISTSTDSVVSVILSWIIVHVVTVVAVAAIVLAGVAVSLAILRVTRCLAVAIAIVAVSVAVSVVVAVSIVALVVTVAVVTVVGRAIVAGGSDGRDVLIVGFVDGQDGGVGWSSTLGCTNGLGFL